MTLTHNPFFLPFSPLPLSVRAEALDGSLFSARGSDDDSSGQREAVKERNTQNQKCRQRDGKIKMHKQES